MTSLDPGNGRWLDDTAVGDWIQLGRADRGFPDLVRDLLPAHFDAYARVLHRVRLNGREFRWQELAEKNRRSLTPAMRVEDLLATTLEEARGEGLTVGGSMSPEEWGALGPSLRRHSSSEAAVLGLWEGRGRPRSASSEGQLSVLSLPNRRYFLAQVPFTEWSSSDVVRDIVNIAWPHDHSWFLNADIDACSTYIGGSRDLVGELLALTRLEVVPSGLDDPVWNY